MKAGTLNTAILRRPEGATDEEWEAQLATHGMKEMRIEGSRRQRRAKLSQARKEVRAHLKKQARSA